MPKSYEKIFFEEWRYVHFKSLINQGIGLFPIPFVCFENMFLVHFMWETRKMGINLFFERDYVPKSEPARLKKTAILHSRMMKLLGWEILDLSWEDYLKKGHQNERNKFLRNWYIQTAELQEKRGVIHKHGKYV